MSQKVDFKARKKLIARECFKIVGRSRTDECGGVVYVRSKGF